VQEVLMFARWSLDPRRVAVSAARSMAATFAIMLLGGAAAWADCTPAAANNVTAPCTGTTTNQGGGAPGTSASTTGYGTGSETGVAVNVVSGATNTVGTSAGIYLGDATVTKNAAASITGGQTRIMANTGFANVTNAGNITGTGFYGIFAQTNATVTNNSGGGITGGMIGIAALASDAALTTASAEIKWLNGWSAAATFEGEFSDETRSYAGKGVVRYAWSHQERTSS
jgi:hypothetical protein